MAGSGPEIGRIVVKFEHYFKDTGSQSTYKHYKQAWAVQNTFRKHMDSVVWTIEDMESPFVEDNGEVLDTKNIMDEYVQTVKNIEAKGLQLQSSSLARSLIAVNAFYLEPILLSPAFKKHCISHV